MNTLINDVKLFLRGLSREFPDVFSPTVTRRLPAKALAPGEPALREKARERFTERVAHWSGKMGVRVGRIRIKDQKSLWASCSANANLNFNWRIVLAPEGIVDYIVIHELAHLLEMNHSPRFWGHVESWCPDWRAHRRWLRLNHELLRSPQHHNSLINK